MISIAVVGIGGWGRNLVRNFVKVGNVRYCCHRGDPDNEAWLRANYPDIDLTTEYASVIEDPSIDAVVVATPISTHYELAQRALKADKHIFVEKPLAASVKEARELRDLARKSKGNIFVGYIFLYHPLLQPLLQRSTEHAVQSVVFSWEKLGAFGENIVLDVVSHPVSIACGLFCDSPKQISVNKEIAVEGGTDLITAELNYAGGGTFDIHVNRVSPVKRRSMLVVFDDETFHWTDERLHRFNREREQYDLVRAREREPLQIECERFVAAIEEDINPLTDGEFGYRVNEVLESLRT